MDDHTCFLLRRLENDIRRALLVVEQLRFHVAELPTDRNWEGRHWLRLALGELERHYRIRAALLEPNPGNLLH